MDTIEEGDGSVPTARPDSGEDPEPDGGPEADADTAVCEGDAADELGRCPSDDPCLGTSCGDHARCTQQDGEAVCRCDPGYDGDGITCIPDPCHTVEDEAPPCGDHQRCEPDADSDEGFACTCEEGFADCDGELDNGCETDLRDDASHCGACDFACAEGLACRDSECEPRVTTIAMGQSSSCALTPAGEVLCWGALVGSDTPTKVDYGPAEQVGVGSAHACIRNETQLTCWGDNTYRQTGSPNQNAPSNSWRVSGLTDLAVGPLHNCVVANGRAHCWGRNLPAGTLGNPDHETDQHFVLNRPVTSGGVALSGVEDVAAELGMNCVRLETGSVQCWGHDLSSNEVYSARGVASTDGPLHDAKSLCVGANSFFFYGCALRDSGDIACWGTDPIWLSKATTLNENSVMELSIENFPLPTWYRSLEWPTEADEIAEITCGGMHACARTTSGVAYCWGLNRFGALGTGTGEPSRATPTRVKGLSDVVGIYAGVGGSCARLRNGRVYCWGNNAQGSLGIGSSAESFNEPQELKSWP